jgi:2',3'-cyclic-nucleotide 2'-phosphodiesterase (5'-nucleotidase family)
MVRRQYMVNKIREDSDDPVLLLSAGDATMGTFFHAATPDAAPDYLAMALLGYDFVTLGNHEFDWGAGIIADAIHAVTDSVFGGAVPVISSNIHFEDVVEANPSHAGADELQKLVGEGDSGAPVMRWATKTLSNGLKIGFVGLTGYNAALVAPFKVPVAFSTPTDGEACDDSSTCEADESCTRGHCVDPLDAQGHIAAMAADVQPYVTHLRDIENVDVVVAITHIGWSDNPLLNEVAALASLTDGIDVIIDGHSHTLLPPTVVASTVGSGSSIIAQAGNYGRYLGELVVTVDPDGTVGYDAAASSMHVIDYNLDVEILADTDIGAHYYAPELTRALTLTGAVVGPVLAGLNDKLGAVLPVSSILDTVVTSDHDIVGEVPHSDTNLTHLVTDAERKMLMGGACMLPDPGNLEFIVSVQANGVIRESLRFGTAPQAQPGERPATAADVFRVLPLGASPLEANKAPGYPIVVFGLTGMGLFAGLEVGVGQGLVEDSFFLSYSGMRVTYDASLPSFDPGTFNPSSPDPQGRVTKIEMSDDAGGWVTLFEQDLSDTTTPFLQRWIGGFNPLSTDNQIRVITNLYLATFLDAFGITAYDGFTGAAITADPYLGGLGVIGQTVMCAVAAAPDCGGGAPSLAYCYQANGNAPGWPFPEAKEWAVLLQYLTGPEVAGGLAGHINKGEYDDSEPFESRVINATPTQ